MKDLKQMDFFPSTSSQADTLANLSPSQVEKKVKKIRDTSGQSILDLSKSSDQLGLLEKMLVDTLNSVSTPYLRTWKAKVTPQGRLVFQLRASGRTTKEKESGSWHTPTVMDHLPTRTEEALKKQYMNHRKGRTEHSTLRDQVTFPKPDQMWRTPDNMAGGSNLPGIQKALDEGHLKRPSGQPIQIRLQDQVREERLWPTPAAHEGRLGYQRRDTGKKGTQKSLTTKVIDKEGGREKTTGQLNPTWVEWLMGYPIGWTDLNVSETASSHKSPTTSDQ